MTTQTETQTETPDDKKEELETEKEELEQDVKETQKEADAAREQGDTAKAEKLEATIQKVVDGALADVKAQLKALTDRPFHPAPEARTSNEGAAEGEKNDDQEQRQVEEKPKERKHRFGSTRWFGDRAYED